MDLAKYKGCLLAAVESDTETHLVELHVCSLILRRSTLTPM